MAIPQVDKDVILRAMQEFDADLLPTDEWRGWDQKNSQVWAISYDSHLYPPKKIVSMATGLSVNEFSGGPETNNYLNGRGFETIRLRQVSLGAIFKVILERYDNARKVMPFSGNHEIKELFSEARRMLQESPQVTSQPNVQVVSSYGKGNWAAIPWISFLDRRETETTQAGTYVVYLFEEGGNGLYIKLAQGVTQPHKELGAKALVVLAERAAEIRLSCADLSQHGFDLSGQSDLHTASKLGMLYQASTIAAKHYTREAMPTEEELLSDLGVLLKAYDAYVAQRPPASKPALDSSPLALLGTWRSLREDAPTIKAKIATNGGWASWWSFPIKDEALARLVVPFNL